MFEWSCGSEVQRALAGLLLGRYEHAGRRVAGLGELTAQLVADAARLGDLADASLLDVAVIAEQVAARAYGVQVRALAVLAGRYEAEGAGEFTADEVAFRLGWGTRAAAARLHEATQLAGRLPGTLGLLEVGAIDAARARVVVKGTDALADADAAAVDAAVAPVARTLTAWQLRDRVAVEATHVDAEASARRHAAGRRDRRVVPVVLPDGLAELVVTGPAPDVHAVFTAVDGLAHGRVRAAGQGGQGGQGIDAARFDALADWAHAVLAGASGDGPPVPGTGAWVGARPHLQLTMSAGTLAGADPAPAHLDGYGYLPAPVARDLLARTGAVVRRLATDPATGAVVGVESGTHDLPPRPPSTPAHGDGDAWPAGVAWLTQPPPSGPLAAYCHGHARRGYRPGAALARLVRARWQRCTAPGCSRPATRCDLDHALAWPAGPTCPCNLHPLCRRHHRMKHHGRTRVRLRDDGAVEWTTRTGHQYVIRPPQALATPRARARPPAATTTGAVPAPVTDGHDAAHRGAAALRAALAPAGTESTEQEPQRPDPGPPPF